MTVGRVILITLDGCGVGALPDAATFGDAGVATLPHVAQACNGLRLPHLQRLGLGNIAPLQGVPPTARPMAAWGRMAERSRAKDTTSGHWELAGLAMAEPFPTYPHGFPAAIIDEFRRLTGLVPLGNIAASGTDILRRLGAEHLASGRPIVYTSSDSVFQIAAHEEIIPPARLYEICAIARTILDPYRVGRVIARPFLGTTADTFYRTSRRHDFSIPPPGNTLLDDLLAAGYPVHGIGKIGDIFANRGLTNSRPTTDNRDGIAATLACMDEVERGLIFTNLVDFDMLYGHRRDASGFGRALEAFDEALPTLMAAMHNDDLLLLTADHGCDPLAAGTDHTREYVPLLIWTPGPLHAVAVGQRGTFADVAATLAELFNVPRRLGTSLAGELFGNG